MCCIKMKAEERMMETWMYTEIATVGKARLEYSNTHKREIWNVMIEMAAKLKVQR